MEQIKTTEDLGFTEIEIAKVGEYNGSDKDGNPIKENLTEESLKAIVDDVNESGREILVDKQHNSMKQGLEKDDSACGWLKALSFKNGSIFGKCFWTKLGRELIDSRILRFISPVFHLNKEGIPTKLVNVALVNQPALSDINPVINSQPTELKEESITDMSKEELVNLIKDTVVEMNSCSNKNDMEVKNEVVDKTKEELKALIEEILAEKAKEEAIRDIKEDAIEDAIEKGSGVVEVIDACGKKDNTVKNETVVEDPKEEEKKVEEKKEVIKEEALNSAPTIGSDISGKNEWENLHGKEFWTWYKKNCRKYR